jgi:hypothetical protein
MGHHVGGGKQSLHRLFASFTFRLGERTALPMIGCADSK